MPSRRLFDAEKREGDTRPKPDLTLRLRSGQAPDAFPSPKRGGAGHGSAKSPGWQPNGIAVCDTAPSALPKVVTDGNSGAIICWTECFRDQVSLDDDIYAQRVDSGGNFVWPSQGVPVCSLKGSYSNYPAMISDGRGGAIIAWEDSRGGLGYTRVFAQRLDSLGNRLWTENGVLVCNQMSGYVDLCTDGHGGAIIAYVDGRDEAITSDNIYAQRIDSAGDPVWAIDGVPVCAADSIQFWPTIINYGLGGAVFAWQDYRSGNYDIYTQMIDSSGSARWISDGVLICNTTNHERYPKIINNSNNACIISWMEYGIYKTKLQSLDSNGLKLWDTFGVNTLGGYDEISPILLGGGVSNSYAAQRVDSLGNMKWGSGILLHGDTTGGQCGAVSDTFSNLFVIWDELRTSPVYSNQYAQKVDTSGNALWGANGVPVCTLQMRYETYPQVTYDGLGGIVCTWFGNPWHAGVYDRVYVQRIYLDGTPGGVAGYPVSTEIIPKQYIQCSPNPFSSSMKIEYSLDVSQNARLNVYNITGQLVKTLSNAWQSAGVHTIHWDGRNDRGQKVSNGVYLIRSKTDHQMQTIKTTFIQ